jgi:hypothetical protein
MPTKLQRACRLYLLRLIHASGPDVAVATLRGLKSTG